MTSQETEGGEGRYLYCVINKGVDEDLGEIGIEDNKVYTISHGGIAAVVHVCSPEPYQPKDVEKAKHWVFTHNYVIDEATKRFGTVLPFSFDSIVDGNDETVQEWLGEEHDVFKDELERLEGKAEYTVQIFCEEDILNEEALEGNQEIKDLKKQVEVGGSGVAYLLEKKIEKTLTEARGRVIEDYSKQFQELVEKHSHETKVSKQPPQNLPDEWKDKGKIILNASCLATDEEVDALGRRLEEINNREGFSVRFTGPWAPFSFAQLEREESE